MKISDLQTTRPVDRIQDVVLLTPETNAALTELSNLLSRTEPVSTPLPTREYERAYRRWLNDSNLSQEVKDKANRIGILKGYDAAMQYYRSVFDALHADLKPSGRPGRPEWYMSPVRSKRISRGDAIAHLINVGAATLISQLKQAA